MAAAASTSEPVENLLRRVPFFRGLDRVDIARLVGALEKVHLEAGALIFSEGAAADALYLLEAGKVQIIVKAEHGERAVVVVEGPGYLGELGLLLARRTASARAVTEVEAWTLPRHRFDQVLHERAAVGAGVAASLARLIEDRSREHAGAVPATRQTISAALPAARGIRPRPWRAAAAAVPIALPMALWLTAPPSGLSVGGGMLV